MIALGNKIVVRVRTVSQEYNLGGRYVFISFQYENDIHALFGCAALLFVMSLARTRDDLDDVNSTPRIPNG